LDFSDAQKEALLASLDEADPDGEYRYDATGRRDPFTPVDFSVKVSVDTTVPPLQRFTLGQLKLSAILRGGSEPSAMVETQEGMGYPVKRGTKIGPDNGEVVEISENKIVIRETQSDFSGAVTERLVEMNLRAGDEKGGFSRPTVR
jgi:Tfp pilus assembly protein PilP